MKLTQNRLNCDVKVRSHLSVVVFFVILILKFNYGLCNQETGDNSDAVLTADSIHNDFMLNDETFKFYDNVDELAANLFNDTGAEYLNDEDEINEENLNKLLESYDKTYTNETWIVVNKDNDIVGTINEIVGEFETTPDGEIVIVTQDINDIAVSRRQHDDLQFGLEYVPAPNEVLIDTTTEGNLNNARAEDVKNPSTEADPENGFDFSRSDENDVHTTETVDGKFRNDETELTAAVEINDDTRREDFEPQTTEAEYFELGNDVSETTSLAPNIEEVTENNDLESTTAIEEGIEYRINKFDSDSTKQDLDELENEDLLIEELDPVIFDLPKSAVPEPVYKDYTTEEEITTKIPDVDELIDHKIYLHAAELPITTNNDYTTIKRPESTTSKPATEVIDSEPEPSILQKISSYVYGIFNYRFGKEDSRNFEIDPNNFSTEIFDEIVTTGYDTDRKRAEEQSILEIEKILDPEIKNEFIKDIVIDKSLELQSVFKKPDESNILNRGLVDSSTETVDVEKFIFDKINRDGKSTVEYESDTIDNNLYSNPVQNSGSNHVPIESKPEDKTIIELEKIIDPEIKYEFIKDIPPSSDHIADIPVIETVKVVDNTDEDEKRIHDESKVKSIENPDLHRVIHENVHTEYSNDEDHTQIEIETNDTTGVLKNIDPEIKNEFIKDILPSSDHIADISVIETVKVVDNADGNREIHMTERNLLKNEKRIRDESKVESIENRDLHRDDTPIEDHSKTEIETNDTTGVLKIIDPEIENEFIKDIPTISDHIVDIPVIETVKVVDNTDGNTEIHMTERNLLQDGKRIRDESKVESIENPNLHRVIHENVHTEHSNDTRIEDHTKFEIETNDTTRVEVQHVTHKEDEKNSQTEKKIEHVTIDKPGLHMENHEIVKTIKNNYGDVMDTEDTITKDFDNVHVVDKIRIHEDNKKVYGNLLKKVEEIKQNKNKIDELKKDIKVLKKDIKCPSELIRYEAEVLKNKGYLPDKLELIAGYLNFREQQLQGNTDESSLKPYLQRLSKERELQILKLQKKKLKKQLIEDFKKFMITEKKIGIQLNEQIEMSVEKFDEESQSSSSKSKNQSSDEHDNDSQEESEERVWNNFLDQARLGTQERVPRREEEVKLLQRVLNDELEIEVPFDLITRLPLVPITPVPVLFPDIDKESQITLLKTLVHIPNVEKEDDLPVTTQTTDQPITTDAIAVKISMEIDEIEKIVDEHSRIVKVIDKRVLLHNGDNNLEIEETVNTQNGDVETEEHNKHIQKIDEKTRSRIIEALMPKLHENIIKKQNLTRQSEGRSLSIEPEVKQTEEPETESPELDENDSVITNEALRTLIEGFEITSEIARSVDNFRSPIEKITEILTAADQTVTAKTTNELADELGRAEEILGVEENKIVGEIAELELVGVNLALILFCIICAFLILIITIIFFLRKSKRFGGLNFVPV